MVQKVIHKATELMRFRFYQHVMELWTLTHHTSCSGQDFKFKIQVYYLNVSLRWGAFCDCDTSGRSYKYLLFAFRITSHYWSTGKMTLLWYDFDMVQLWKCIYDAWKVKECFRELWLTAENFGEIILLIYRYFFKSKMLQYDNQIYD